MPERKSNDAKLQAVINLADVIADEIGVRIVDVKFGQQGKKRTLEVTIFRPDGAVSHDDCEKVSRQLDAALDEKATSDEPVMDGAYMLEVQSPGIDRAIKTEREYRIFSGQKVQIETKEKVEDLGHNVIGILLGLVEGKVKLAHAHAAPKETKKGVDKKAAPVATQEVSIDQKKITQIKLYAPDLAPKSKESNL